MIVIGSDPGTEKCGYAALRFESPARCSLIEAGTMTASAALGVADRLREIGTDLEQWCAELKATYPGETFTCGIEAGYLDGHGATALILSEARGVVSFVLAKAFGTGVARYYPATIKKVATGSGKASKDLVARAVQARLKLKRQPAPDVADAIAIAITRIAITRMTIGEPLTKEKR